MNKIYLLGLLLLILLGCNKSNRYASKIEGNKWKLSKLTVEGTVQTLESTLLFKDCDIYEESCMGSWINASEGRAAFAWQFRDKGKTLEISNQTDHAHSIEDINAAELCINFSGVYTVEKCTRQSIIIHSEAAHGFKGKKIELELTKIK